MGNQFAELIKDGDWNFNEMLANVADCLLANGVILPPVKVGQTVYFLLECDDEWCLSEDTVTEVCSSGFYVSAFSPPQSDHGHFTEYGELGGTVFTDKGQAELALKEREGT
jgi:hypothetical protein